MRRSPVLTVVFGFLSKSLTRRMRISEQIFDISVAVGKPKIQPDRVLNDHGWKSVRAQPPGLGNYSIFMSALISGCISTAPA